MLKLIATFLLIFLPSQAWPSAEPCDVQDSQQESSISCQEIRISHSDDQAKIEFIDGFTLFFHFGQSALEDQVKFKAGERSELKVTAQDQKMVLRLTQFMGKELTSIEAKVIDLFNQFPMNKPLDAGDPLRGGEVPWPIPEDGENPEKPKKD